MYYKWSVILRITTSMHCPGIFISRLHQKAHQIILFALIGALFPGFGFAQSQVYIPADSQFVAHVDSLLESIDSLQRERDTLSTAIQKLETQLNNIDHSIGRGFGDIRSQNRRLGNELEVQFDSLKALIPSEEPLLAAQLYMQLLSQRQDTLMAYIQRLEMQMEELPKNQYWGIRNNFKEFDHLLLFTFLGAIMSLGVLLLLRNDSKKLGDQNELDTLAHYLNNEEHIDRLSTTITLLVGSILVVLFVIFIL